MANRAAGKGYENEAFYENIKFQFLGIENIHVMRNSLQKVIESKSNLLLECNIVSFSFHRVLEIVKKAYKHVLCWMHCSYSHRFVFFINLAF